MLQCPRTFADALSGLVEPRRAAPARRDRSRLGVELPAHAPGRRVCEAWWRAQATLEVRLVAPRAHRVRVAASRRAPAEFHPRTGAAQLACGARCPPAFADIHPTAAPTASRRVTAPSRLGTLPRRGSQGQSQNQSRLEATPCRPRATAASSRLAPPLFDRRSPVTRSQFPGAETRCQPRAPRANTAHNSA